MAEAEIPAMIRRVAEKLNWLRECGVGPEEVAKQAIEAMREPTEQMVWDGGTALHDEKEDTTGVWKAMIDSALNSRP